MRSSWRVRRATVVVAAGVVASSLSGEIRAHPGPRVWLGSSSDALVTYASNDDLAPTTFAPSRAFVGGIDEDTLTPTGLLEEFPVSGTEIWASQFPGYQVRSDGQSGISTGSSFSFDLGPLLVFDGATHAFKTTWQTFGTPGPAPQFAATAGTSSANTGPGVTSGFSFFSYNTTSDHAHLVMALLGNGTQTVDGPQRVYALPMQLSGGGLAKSLPYYILLGRNIDKNQPEFQDAISVVNATIASIGGTWIVDTDGDWSTTGNWFANVPAQSGAAGTFGGAISAPRTVTLNAPRSIGRVTFDSVNRYTLAGPGTLTLSSGTSTTVSVLSGSHTIAAPLVFPTNATVSVAPASSTLTLSNLRSTSAAISKTGAGNLLVNSLHAGNFSVSAGTVTIAPSGGPSSLGLLSLSPGATLDVNDNDLITATPRGTIETLVRQALNGGAWNAPGLTSSAARSNSVTGLGVLSGAEYSSVGGNGTFSGQTYTATDTLVKYTWNGDANLDGRVTFDDYVKIDTGFNTGRTGWFNGDFNYSGNVNFDDYVLIDIAFNQQNGTLEHAIEVVLTGDPFGRGSNAAEIGVEQVVEHLNKLGPEYAEAFLAAAMPEPAFSFAAVSVLALIAGRRIRRVD